jgi:thymidylate synthase (FAD)
MKVTLIDYTGVGQSDPQRFAAAVLLFTKSTRLEMNPGLFDKIYSDNWVEIFEGLRQMANTNPGSWEFIHFTFLIEDVTRAFTQQLQRTRTASYAQQTLRVLKMDKWKYAIGPSIKGNVDREVVYDYAMRTIGHCYDELIAKDAAIEDARGILPLNILTNLCISINMRNFISLTRKRTSPRVQKEYTNIMDLMVIEVEKVYKWFHIFYKNDEMQAYKDVFEFIQDLDISNDRKLEIIKKLDIIKSGIN